MNSKFSIFVICVEAIYICYYIICMTVPLNIRKKQGGKESTRLNQQSETSRCHKKAYEYTVCFLFLIGFP